jgi:putative Ca2+/H+ antiporter (TMEM165/GDT1 family)
MLALRRPAPRPGDGWTRPSAHAIGWAEEGCPARVGPATTGNEPFVDLPLIALVFGIILLAELPDKTMFAALVLGTRFSARWVFLGAAVAFTVHVVIAVAAGSLLGLLPQRALDLIVAALFLVGAAVMLHASAHGADAEPDAVRSTVGRTSIMAAVASSFMVIFLGEWGDITQIATANLAARYQDPLSVGVGAALGLWTAALVGISAGRGLLRLISAATLQRIGAVVFLGLACFSLAKAAA